MRHGDEQAQVLEFLYATLSTDPELAALAGVEPADMHTRAWPDPAPGHVLTPFVVFSAAEALDWQALGMEPRLGTAVPFTVRWVTEGQDATAGAPAARRLYQLLHGRRNVPVSDGGTILTTRRTASLSYPEDAAGVQYHHTGGQFMAEVN